jgi:hypothetical protein
MYIYLIHYINYILRVAFKLGRRATSLIKDRKRTTLYLMPDLDTRVRTAYIRALNVLGYQIDKTRFFDALIETGLKHSDDITKHFKRKLTDFKP